MKKHMKKHINYIVAIVMIATLFLLVTFTQNKEIEITEDDKQTYSLAPSIATSHTQTNTYTVKSINSVYVGAGTYWYQLGDKRWRADTEFGAITVANKNNYPTPTVVKERHDLSNWQLYGDQAFRSDNGRVFNGAQLNEKFIASANDAKFRNASSFSGKGIQVENGTKVVLNFESGYGYTPTKYNLIAGSTTRYEAMYLTPFDVYWSGKVIETYEISTDPDTTINSGTTKQLFAFTRSKTGKEGWTGYKNVTSVPETKWTTDNPSVATVSSTGVVTGLKGGVATITATWKSGDYHIKASTKVTVKQMVVGTFLLNGKTNVCLSEGSLAIQALYYEGTSTGTNVLAETSLLTSNHNIASINAKIIYLHSVGKVTITGKYKDKTHTLTITIIDCNTNPKPTEPTEPTPTEPTPQEPEEPKEPEKPKLPPQVMIYEVPEVTVGEYFCFVAYATDEDGYITNYNWDKGSFVTTDTTSSAICGYYEKVGKPSIKVTVTDNDGLTASATTTTNVKTATPSAYVYVSGDLRENRIVKVGVSDPYNDNEVLHQLAPITKQTLEVSVVNEGDEIKYQKEIPSTFTSDDIFEFIAKFSGEVKVKRTVENKLGQKDSFETTFFIAPDLAPVVDFRVSEVNYRSYDEVSGEPATAKISIDDSSYSIDGDKISKRILTVTFDANNNGIFTDDIPNVIELSEDQKNVEFTTQKVGKYLVEMEVWEDIFTNTFFEYVDLTYNKESTDLRFSDTSKKPISEKITEVDNIAPSTSLNLSVRKKASVQVDVTNSPFTKEELQKQQATLNKELVQKNIVADLTFFDNTINMDNVKYYVTGNKRIHFLQTADNEMYVKYLTTQKHTFPSKIKKVVMGYQHAFVLLESNVYYAIGVNLDGELGGNHITTTSTGNTNLVEYSGYWRFYGIQIADLSAGRGHSLFLTTTGDLYAAGDNEFKQLGTSSPKPYGEPTKITTPKKVKGVVASFYASMLLTESNTMLSVGQNDSGHLGLGNTSNQTSWKESTVVKDIKQMFYTDSLSLILSTTNGAFYGVGLNLNDNMNVGSTNVYVTRPTLIKDVPVGTIKILSNSSASALLTNTGEVYVRGQARNVGVNATGSGWTKVTAIDGKAKDIAFYDYSSGSVIISTDKGFYHVVSSKMEKIDVYGIFGLEEPKAHDITEVAKGYQHNYVVGLNQQGTEAYYKDVMKNLADGHFVGVSKTQDTIINNVIKWNENRGSYINLGNDTKEVEIEKMYKKLSEYIISVMDKKTVDVQYDVFDSPYTEEQLKTMTPYLNSLLSEYDLKANINFANRVINKGIFEANNKLYYYNEKNELIENKRGTITIIDFPENKEIKEVYGVTDRTHFLTTDGEVYAYGISNTSINTSALGIGSSVKAEIPTKVNLPDKVKQISYSPAQYHFEDGSTLFLLENGDVYVAGDYIQGSKKGSNIPVKIFSDVDYIAGYLRMYLVSGHNINEYVKEGDRDTGASYRRTNTFAIPENIDIKTVKTKFLNDNYPPVFIESTNGDVYVIGDNYNDRLGITTNGKVTKVPLPSKLKKTVMNQYYSLYLLENGEVYATGQNNVGQLGIGTTTNSGLTKVKINEKVIDIVSNQYSAIFITDKGNVYFTGQDYYNILGITGTYSMPRLLSEDNIPFTFESQFIDSNNITFNTAFNSKKDFTVLNQDLKGYYVGVTTSSNKQAVEKFISNKNSNKGTFIDIGTSYTNEDLKATIEQLADYIVQTQSENSIEVEFLFDESTGLTKEIIEEQLNTTFKNLITPDETIILHETLEDGTVIEKKETIPSNIFLRIRAKEITSDYQYTDSVLDGKHRFIVALKTDDYTKKQKTHLKAVNLINNAYFVGVGSSNNEDSIRNIIQTSMHKGTYLELNDLESVLNEVATYVLATLENNRKIQELFITTDESVNYNAVVNDYEMDEIAEEYWKFNHELNYFESETGLISEHNVKLNSPIERFKQTGRYLPTFAVQDDPLTRVFDENEIPLFESYKKWSNESDNWRIYVHKKPSSDFTFTLNQLDGAFSVTSTAYDADKASIDIGKGQGLQAQSFTWRLEGDYEWKDGIPSSNLEANKVYEIRNTVVDLQGTSSSTTKLLSRTNLPPVAVFETNKEIYIIDEDVVITNTSYDPNGDDMIAQWKIKEDWQGDAAYNTFATGEYKDGKGNNGWNPIIKAPECDTPNEEGICTFVIQLTVTDENGEKDTTTRTIQVITKKIEKIKNPSKDVSGTFYWELQHQEDETGLKIVALPTINSVHAEIRNIVYGFDIKRNEDLSVRKEARNVNDVEAIELFITDYEELKDIQNKDITFYVEYKYTNHIEIKGKDGKPKWEEYEETFVLSNEIPDKDLLTLKLDHQMKEVLKVDDLTNQKIKDGFIVGRDIVIDMSNKVDGEKVVQREFKEYITTDVTYKEKHMLQTQSRLPMALVNMLYKVHVPSNIQNKADYQVFIKDGSKGEFIPIELDKNLNEELIAQGNLLRKLSLSQSNVEKLNVNSSNDDLAHYQFNYNSDLFFVSKHTGYTFIMPYSEYEELIKQGLTWGQVVKVAEEKMKKSFEEQTNTVFKDSIVNATFEDTQYYYLPISLDSKLKPKHQYENKYKLENIGLNLITIEFEQPFEFKQYLFGNTKDNPIYVEQQESPIASVLYTNKIRITDDQLMKLIELQSKTSNVLHDFRYYDRTVIEEVKSLLMY